jgi:DNA-directed RNA polymerase subunit L
MDVGGEGHTLLNLLQSSLLADKDVKMAGYAKQHPLMDRAVLQVQMKSGKSPREALLKSAEDARKRVNDFLDKFNDQVAKKRSP